MDGFSKYLFSMCLHGHVYIMKAKNEMASDWATRKFIVLLRI